MVGGLSHRVCVASSSLALRCRSAPIAGAGEHAPSGPAGPIQRRRGRAAPLVSSGRAGEYARGPVRCADHDPASPGDGDRPRRLFGQSRPNPTHASSLRTANHFPGTPASLPGHFAQVREMPRSRRERRPGEAGGGRRGLADAESLSSHLRRRRHSGASKGRPASHPRRSKITNAKCHAVGADSCVLMARSSRNWGWLYQYKPLLSGRCFAAAGHPASQPVDPSVSHRAPRDGTRPVPYGSTTLGVNQIRRQGVNA